MYGRALLGSVQGGGMSERVTAVGVANGAVATVGAWRADAASTCGVVVPTTTASAVAPIASSAAKRWATRRSRARSGGVRFAGGFTGAPCERRCVGGDGQSRRWD